MMTQKGMKKEIKRTEKNGKKGGMEQQKDEKKQREENKVFFHCFLFSCSFFSFFLLFSFVP